MCTQEQGESCRRALHRDEAKVTRWILSDHDETERPKWRERLAFHLRCATAR